MGSSFIKSGSKLLTSSLDFCQMEKTKGRDVTSVHRLLDTRFASLVLSAMNHYLHKAYREIFLGQDREQLSAPQSLLQCKAF